MQVQTGYLLTSHWSDTEQGLQLDYYGTNGKRPFKLSFTGQKLVFFIPRTSDFRPNNFSYERKSQSLKNFKHEAVDTIYLNRYQDLALARDYCQQNAIISYEMDVLPTERFLMERFINAEVEFKGDAKTFGSIDCYENPQIRPGKYAFHPLSLLSLDIETGTQGQLYSIALDYKKGDQLLQKVLMKSDETCQYDETLFYYASEKEILNEFLQIVKQWDPDLITGWHVIGFDLKFLENKFIENKLEFRIGRLNEKIQIIERKGSGFYTDLPGRVVLDGPPVLRGAFYQFKDFKLETVANEVLGTGKDISSDADKVLEIERRFREDKPALARYNLLDCTLVIDILEKLKIVDLLVKRTHISGMLMDRLPISTAAFDHVYLPRIHRRGYVAPNKIDIVREEASGGGMVIEPKAGLHHNVAVFDFKSLYPSIIMTFKIDPFSRIQNEINPIRTPSGLKFSYTENILSEVIESLMQLRTDAKKQQNANLSQAIKILMNSFYGVMGASRCRFYHADLPVAITTAGQWILKKSMEFFENHNHEVLYGDTDSIFIQMSEKMPLKYCEELAAQLNTYMKKILHDEFHVISYLECEYEKTFDKLFFSAARSGEGVAKKKYAGIVDHKLEFKGMEVVRSDWTELAKNFQTLLYEKFFAAEDLEPFIKNYIESLKKGDFDDDLVYKKRLTKDPAEYTKNIPVHVKAALKIDYKGPYRLKEVSYVMANEGPVPVGYNHSGLDYHHYIEKQLRPIANDILVWQGKNFDSITSGEQLSLFDI